MGNTNQLRKVLLEDWKQEGEARFGKDYLQWKFKCPACGHVQTPEDFRKYKDRGAVPDTAHFCCIGRFLPKNERGGFSKDHANPNVKEPCDYTCGGLFKLSPLLVIDSEGKEIPVFEFA